jgi:hypothetical protein
MPAKQRKSTARRSHPARFTKIAATTSLTMKATGTLETDDQARRRRYEQTGHPFDPWQTYLASRARQQPIPEWVLKYFDDAAEKIVASVHLADQPARLSAAVASALGFTSKGAGSVARRSRVAATHDALAQRVSARVRQGEPVKTAIANVAQEQRVSYQTVEHAWLALPADERNRIRIPRPK